MSSCQHGPRHTHILDGDGWRACNHDQQRAQVAVTSLGDMAKPVLGATAMLARHQTKPSGKLAPFLKSWPLPIIALYLLEVSLRYALAHRLPDQVEAAYRRGTLPDKRTLLMRG